MGRYGAELEARDCARLTGLLGFLLGVLGIAALMYAGALPPVSGSLALGLLAVGLWRPRWRYSLSSRTAMMLLAAGLALSIADLVVSLPEVLGPSARFLALLLTARCWLPRGPREELQLILLSIIALAVSGVLTLSLTFALFALAFATVGLIDLFFVNLAGGYERAGELPKRPFDGFRWMPFLRRTRAMFGLRFIAYTGGLVTALCLIAAIIFTVIPRFDTGRFLALERLGAGKARAGFSETVRLGSVSEIIQDDGVALRVEPPEGVERLPVEPYWRMLALDEYRDGTFSLSASAERAGERWRGRTLLMPNRFQLEFRGRPEGAGRWTYYLEPSVSRYLPRGGPFSRVEVARTEELRLFPHINVLSMKSMSAEVFAYRIDALEDPGWLPQAQADRRLVNPDTNELPLSREEAYRRYPLSTLNLEVSASEREQLEVWAAAITAQAGPGAGVADFGRTATLWLRSRHSYSLNPGIPAGAGDPMCRWIPSRASGHCELFAGSLVLLARAAGIPARMVVGFSGGDWNGYEGYYRVRNRYAHAWAELYDSGAERWLRVDPTPGYGGPDGGAVAASLSPEVMVGSTGLSAYLDSLRLVWYRRVVQFGGEDQINLATSVRDFATGVAEGVRQAWVGLRKALTRLLANPPVAIAVFLGTALVLGGFYLGLRAVVLWLRRRWLRRRGLDEGERQRHQAGRLLRRIRQARSRLGQGRQPVSRVRWRKASGGELVPAFGYSVQTLTESDRNPKTLSPGGKPTGSVEALEEELQAIRYGPPRPVRPAAARLRAIRGELRRIRSAWQSRAEP